MANISFEKDIDCVNFAPMFMILDEQGYDTSFIEKKTGLVREQLTRRGESTDLETGKQIFAAVKELLGDPDPMLFLELGIQATRYRSYGLLIDIGEQLGSVAEVVKFIPRFNAKFNDIFAMSAYDVTKNQATLTITYTKKKYDGHWIFDQNAWNLGNIIGIPQRLGLPIMTYDEPLCRFSLQEIFRDYSFTGHNFEMRKGRAYCDGKEFAKPVLVATEPLRLARDTLTRFNPFQTQKKTCHVLTNQIAAAGEKVMMITRELKISDRLTLQEGQVFGAPYCRLNLNWQKKIAVEKKLDHSVATGTSLMASKPLIQHLEDELEHSKGLYQKLQAQIEQEKKLERQMIGGFAHEIGNALSGGKYELEAISSESHENQMEHQLTVLTRAILSLEQYGVPKDALREMAPKLKSLKNSIIRTNDTLTHLETDLSRALELKNQLMAFSRLQEQCRGSDELDLYDIVKQIINSYENRIKDNDIAVNTRTTKTFKLKGYKTQIDSIIRNLLLNAIDAVLEKRPPRTINITLSEEERVNGNYSIVVIEDNGSGIKETEIEKIFDPFYTTKPSTGTGLGLPWVKRMVDLYGGKITVESTVGKGSTFRIELKS